MHTYIHTPACMHACMCTDTYIHACMSACMHLYIHIYTYTYIDTCMYVYMHTYIHACIHTYIPTYTHTHKQRERIIFITHSLYNEPSEMTWLTNKYSNNSLIFSYWSRFYNTSTSKGSVFPKFSFKAFNPHLIVAQKQGMDPNYLIDANASSLIQAKQQQLTNIILGEGCSSGIDGVVRCFCAAYKSSESHRDYTVWSVNPVYVAPQSLRDRAMVVSAQKVKGTTRQFTALNIFIIDISSYTMKPLHHHVCLFRISVAQQYIYIYIYMHVYIYMILLHT
jgi:hypothetical protein